MKSSRNRRGMFTTIQHDKKSKSSFIKDYNKY